MGEFFFFFANRLITFSKRIGAKKKKMKMYFKKNCFNLVVLGGP